MPNPSSNSFGRLLWMAALCCFAVNFSARAQTPSPSPQQVDDVVRTNIELVQTEVTVFDRQGKFVDSLTPEQFTLSVDGQRRPISLISRVIAGSKFEAEQLANARGGPKVLTTPGINSSTPSSRPGRIIFFFIDDLHLSSEGVARGRKALFHFVDQQMEPEDQVAIVSTSGQIGFLQQLTDNRVVLRAAIGRLGNKRRPDEYVGKNKISEHMVSQIQDGRNSQLFAYLMDSVKVEFGMGLGALRGAHNNDSAGQAARLLQNSIRTLGAQMKADTAATLEALKRLMQASASLPGRKLIFFLSDGFIVDPRGSNALNVMEQLTRAAAQSGAVIYSMDSRGTSSDTRVSASHNEFVDMTSRQKGMSLGEIMTPREPLSLLADETGGRAIFNSNSIENAIDLAVRETSEYYVLAWRPDVETERSGKSRIEVSIAGRLDLSVRLRHKYFSVPGPSTSTSKKDQAATSKKSVSETQLLAALGSLYPTRSLPTSLSVGYLRSGQSEFTLQASMQIPRDVLNAASVDGKKVDVDVLGAAIDDRGLIYSFKHVLTVIPQTADHAADKNVIWNQQLKVKPGLYQVRVAVRDRQTGRSGSAMQWIEIPAVDQERFSMSSLFLGERGSGTELEDSRGLQPIRVDVDHRFQRASVLRFQTYVYNASRLTGNPDVWIQTQVLRGRQQVASLPPNRIPTEVTKDPSRLPYWTEISLNELPAGRYTLQVSATDRATNNNASQTIDFSVE